MSPLQGHPPPSVLPSFWAEPSAERKDDQLYVLFQNKPDLFLICLLLLFCMLIDICNSPIHHTENPKQTQISAVFLTWIKNDSLQFG